MSIDAWSFEIDLLNLIGNKGCIGEQSPWSRFLQGRAKSLVEIHFALLKATHTQAGFIALHLTVAIGLYADHSRGGQGDATGKKGSETPSLVLGERGKSVVDGTLPNLGI